MALAPLCANNLSGGAVDLRWWEITISNVCDSITRVEELYQKKERRNVANNHESGMDEGENTAKNVTAPKNMNCQQNSVFAKSQSVYLIGCF